MPCANVFYTLVILNQTVWSQISSNCVDNSHEAQLVMLYTVFVLMYAHYLEENTTIVETVKVYC